MRRGLVVVAIVSTSIACGEFLGFGDDDEPPPSAPSNDGGIDVALNADGSTTPPSGFCERHVLDFSKATDVDAAAASDGWQTFSTGTLTMEVVDGKLHISSDVPGTDVNNEGNVGRRVDGPASAPRLSRLTCKFDYASTDWGITTGGQGRFAQFRLFGSDSDWVDFYDVHADWDNGLVRSAVQAKRADGGLVESFDNRANTLPVGQPVPFEVDFVSNLAGGDGTFHVGMGPSISIDQPAPGPTRFHAVRAIVGVFTPPRNTSPAYAVDIGNIDCNFCFEP